jgi:hypothetical protein
MEKYGGTTLGCIVWDTLSAWKGMESGFLLAGTVLLAALLCTGWKETYFT